MRLLRILAPVACVVAVVVANASSPAVREATPRTVTPSALQHAVRLSPENLNYAYTPNLIKGRRSKSASASAMLSTFVVNYNAAFEANPAAKAAFQAAVDTWSQIVASPAGIPIVVDARFVNLGDPQLLGAAGPTEVCDSPAGIANTFYSAALANKLNGNTSCGAPFGSQIDASLNSTYSDWDFGTTGTPVSGKVNFMTVAMHELAHGLGFIGSMTSSGGVGSFGYAPGNPGFVDIYDRFAVTGGGVPLLSFANPSTALHAQLVGDSTFFNGPAAVTGNGGVQPKLETKTFFGPGTDNGFLPGSSYQHIDDAFYTSTPNGLMTYALASGEVYTDPGPIVRGIFADLGWGGCTFSVSPTTVSLAAAGGSGSVALTTQAGCAWTASSGNTSIATITSAASGTGSATVSYNVSANSSVSYRVVTLSIGGQTVTITQAGTGPTMSLDRTSLVFSAVTNGIAFSAQTSAQAVRLVQSGSGTVTWTASSNANWLTVSPTSGSGSATLQINTQFVANLGASQTGTITLTFTGAGNPAGPINVTLTTISAAQAGSPFGSFDTPATGTTGIAGSIAVTGWALDDVEITRVRIFRDPVGGETPGQLVFIGDAVLVEGARPDVQALHPTLPRNTRAGWGYLMLTNFLPSLGNGTFTIYAIAEDADGHSTTLGSKIITCDNASSISPTGAIDTPAQGATVSGTVTNFGWVLSPGTRRADPPGGGTVRVVIDGAIVPQVPGGWTSRADLSALFPVAQYSGINTALGVASFDSTTMTNGTHTIAWLVTDNLGQASGIGSRYIQVSNGSLMFDPGPSGATAGSNTISTPSMLSMPRAAAQRIGSAASLAAEVGSAPGDVRAISGRRGYSLETPFQAYAFRGGLATIQAEELDRIELRLRGGSSGQFHAGYMRVGDSVAPLPIGSTLNSSTGVFTWQPGVGFVGNYDLVFVRWAGGRAVSRQDVRVVLNPKGSNRVGPQVVIDLPAEAGSHLQNGIQVDAKGFVVAGWAADLGATADSGVGTVHVWAYPAAGGQPTFVGEAAIGGSRPDVAAVHGAQFVKSGYGILVRDLPPGTYDLAVFAYSTVSGGFVPAKTVRVTIR